MLIAAHLKVLSIGNGKITDIPTANRKTNTHIEYWFLIKELNL